MKAIVMFLDELAIEQCARILSVKGEGEVRRRLLDMGLTPGTVVKLVRMAPLGDPMQLCLRGYKLSLRREAAKDIEIEPLSACPGVCGRACARASSSYPRHSPPRRGRRKGRWPWQKES